MAKWVLLAVVVGVALWWWRSAQVRRRPPAPPARPEPGPGAPQAMVRCAHCQLLLPQAEAYAESDPGATPRHYCSEAHRRAGPQR